MLVDEPDIIESQNEAIWPPKSASLLFSSFHIEGGLFPSLSFNQNTQWMCGAPLA